MHRTFNAIACTAVADRAINRINHFLLASLCLVTLLVCVSAQPLFAIGPAAPRYAYVADNANQILEFSITPKTGVLVALGACPLAPLPGVTPNALKVDPTGQWLFVVGPTSNFVWMFPINRATGCLIFPAIPTPLVGAVPIGLALTSNGQFLFVSETGTATIEGFTVNPFTGALAPVALPNILPVAGPNSSGIAIDSPGSYVYVASPGGGSITGFSFNSGTGALAPIAGGVVGTPTPLGLAFDDVHQYLYAANGAPANMLSSYQVTPGGLLAPNVPVPAGNGTNGVAATPFGELAYVSNDIANSVSSYLLNPVTGQPAVNGPAKLTVAPRPTGIHVDQTGNFLYVADSAGPAITGYTINPINGTIAKILGSPWAAGIAPVAIATMN